MLPLGLRRGWERGAHKITNKCSFFHQDLETAHHRTRTLSRTVYITVSIAVVLHSSTFLETILSPFLFGSNTVFLLRPRPPLRCNPCIFRNCNDTSSLRFVVSVVRGSFIFARSYSLSWSIKTTTMSVSPRSAVAMTQPLIRWHWTTNFLQGSCNQRMGYPRPSFSSSSTHDAKNTGIKDIRSIADTRLGFESQERNGLT